MVMDIKQLFQQALQYYQRQQFEECNALLISITRMAAGFAAAWHVKALTERKLGMFIKSEESFLHALALSPAEAEICSNYANLLKFLGRISESAKLFQKAIGLKPDFVDAKYNYALLNMERKLWRPAEELLQSVLKLSPSHVKAVMALVRCYQALGESNSAMSVVADAMQLNPDEPSLLRLQAELYRQQGDFTTAINLLTPFQSDLTILREIALCEFLSGSTTRAVRLLEQAIQQTPSAITLHQTLADIRWQNNDQNWLSSYEEVLKELPQHTALRLDYIAKLIKSDDYARAEHEVDAALSENPSVELMLFKGYLRREASDVDAALHYLQQASKLSKNAPRVDSELLITLLCAGNYRQALQVADGLTQREPLNQAGWAMLAASYKLADNDKAYCQLYQFDQFISGKVLSPPDGFNDLNTFNQALLKEIERLHSGKKPPLMQSLRQGTQSEDNLFLRDSTLIQQLKQQITAAVHQYILQLDDDTGHPFLNRKAAQFLYSGAWSVRLNRSGYHRNHYHSEGWISGCYYVSVPTAVNHNGNGWIKFGQPELSRNIRTAADYYLKPEAGLLVLFPSMMWHGTEPFEDDEYRVTVAFDLVPYSPPIE